MTVREKACTRGSVPDGRCTRICILRWDSENSTRVDIQREGSGNFTEKVMLELNFER